MSDSIKFNLKHTKIDFLGSSVIRLKYSDHVTITKENCEEIVKLIQQHFPDKKYNYLNYLGENCIFDHEARTYISEPDCQRNILAEAFVCPEDFQFKVMGVYVQLEKNIVPTKICRTENEALEFLNNFH